MFCHGDLYRLKVIWPHGQGDRIPTAARRVVQDPCTLIFNAQVWEPPELYMWQTQSPAGPEGTFLIYEAHPGMALEAERIGTWKEFRRHILPKIVDAGYNTIQLMAVQEHPYYGSFGYHVSSFLPLLPGSAHPRTSSLSLMRPTGRVSGCSWTLSIPTV